MPALIYSDGRRDIVLMADSPEVLQQLLGCMPRSAARSGWTSALVRPGLVEFCVHTYVLRPPRSLGMGSMSP